MALARTLAELDADNREDLAAGRYAAALRRMAALQGPVDAFFDGVMVNAHDPDLRRNRLALLSQLRRQWKDQQRVCLAVTAPKPAATAVS